jgi:hypothetical protein
MESKNVELMEAESRVVVSKGWVGGKLGKFSSKGAKFQLDRLNFWK